MNTVFRVWRDQGDTDLLDRVRRDVPSESWYDLYTNQTLRELSLFTAWVDYIFFYLYTIVAVVGVVANGLVLFKMCTSRKLRTPSNYFITNLAASDLVVLLVLLSTRVYITFESEYFRMQALVQVATFLQHICIQSTAFILAAMSFTRYHFIVHPLKARAEWTSGRVWILCGISWIVSSIIYIPVLLGVLYVNDATSVGLNPIPVSRKIFSTVRLFPMFVIPGLIVLLSYGKILAEFRGRDHFMRRTSMQANESFQKKADVQTRKLTKMVVVIILVFFLSWGPFQVFLSAIDLRHYFMPRTPLRWKVIAVTTNVLRLFAYLGCTVNPFIYAYSNPAFMKVKKPNLSFFSNKTNSTVASTTGNSQVELNVISNVA